MKKYSLAFVMLATTLAVAPPSALCDSFGYRNSDSKFGMTSSFEAAHGSAPNEVAESGIFTNTDMAGIGGSIYSGALGHKTVESPITGAFFFDNLLQGNKGGRQENPGALIDLSGQQLVLLSGSDDRGPKSGKTGQFFFADKGTYHVSNELHKSGGLVRSSTTALTVTPEPGSLFLLGTGLLGLALVLFWKAAKHTTGT
jgi:hypothetical protein